MLQAIGSAMFLRLPFEFDVNLQHVALILNTALLISILIVMEVVYSEAPKEKRQHLRYFFPLVLVVAGMLVYAVYLQSRSGS